MIEFERRWKVKNLPEKNASERIHIEQYFISKSKHTQTRIRKSETLNETWFTHCTKYFVFENGREEFETGISLVQFERILSVFPEAKKETKNRIIVELENGLFAEIDIFEDGNMVVEVEFSDIVAGKDFIPPQWFGEEIKDKSFSKREFLW